MANGPWLRVYAELIDNRKVQSLPDRFFRWCINLWCLAKLNNGPIGTTNDVAWRLRKPEKETSEAINYLIAARLLERMDDGSIWPHDWDGHQFQSDSSTLRVQKHRKKQHGNVTCNVSSDVARNVTGTLENRTEQNRTEQSKIERSFESLYERHPKQIKRTLAEQQYVSLLAPLPHEQQANLIAAIDAGHRNQFAGFDGDAKFVPSLDSWLRDRRWTDKTEAKTPEPVERVWTPEEIAEAERREVAEMADLARRAQERRLAAQQARQEKRA